MLLIQVTLTVDNATVFTQSSYTAVVPENAPLDWSVAQLQSFNPDEVPDGKVEYSFAGEGRLEGKFLPKRFQIFCIFNFLDYRIIGGRFRNGKYNCESILNRQRTIRTLRPNCSSSGSSKKNKL